MGEARKTKSRLISHEEYDELVKRAELAGDERVRWFAEELRLWWSFDNGQRHTHSWHTREDFIEKKLPQLLGPDSLKRPSVSGGEVIYDGEGPVPSSVAAEATASPSVSGRGQPSTFVLVPSEPTESMVKAGENIDMPYAFDGDPSTQYPDVPNIYKAMLATALKPPAGE